nr:MAG TPA: deoxynucleoside monophosphate kinase [Caudoviricetes sp.]
MRIGFMGLAGVGKDTAAKLLHEMSGIPLIAFAKPLHDAAIHVFGADALERDNKERELPFTKEMFERFYSYHIGFLQKVQTQYGVITADNLALPSKRFYDVFGNLTTLSPRKLMQLYGTEYWRAERPTLFVDLVRDNFQDAIVTDVRFENEAAICNVLIVIKRNGIKPVAGHTSEAFAALFNDLPECLTFNMDCEKPTVIIDNNGTIEELRQKLKNISLNNV